MCSGVLTAICSIPPHGKLFNATSQERLAAALFFALTLSVYQQLDLSEVCIFIPVLVFSEKTDIGQ